MARVGLVALLLACVSCGGYLGYTGFVLVPQARAVIDQFLKDLDNDRTAAAYQTLADTEKSARSQPEWEESIRRKKPYFTGITRTDISGFKIDGLSKLKLSG